VRVLLVHNRYRSAQPSGENGVVDNEARLLAERGIDVRRFETASDDIATWPAPRRATLPLRVVWSRDGARRVRAAIDAAAPDVVHFHNTFPLLSPAAFRAARAAGVPVVATLHNFRPLCPAATFFRDGRVCEDCLGRAPLPAVRHRCYRKSALATAPIAAADALHAAIGTWARSVDVFLTPSAFARTKYLEAGWPPGQVRVKANTSTLEAAPRTDAGAGFVYLGRLMEEKGVDVLLDAWGRAFPAGGERLTIVGSGDIDERLRRAAAPLAGVEFTGQVSSARARELLRTARALVVPSVWYEVFPLVVLEAYALGVPVVAPRLGSLAEVVRHAETGLTYSPGSADGLAEALATLAASPALARELGRGGRALFDAEYSPTVTTERLIDVYSSVAPAAPAPRARADAALAGTGAA
jgi:glycosyltransferase involved in cell wall biosynthesis